MRESSEFFPDWASAPGETIADLLLDYGMPAAELASQMDLPTARLEALLKGQEQIDTEIAGSLARVLGATPSFWLSREERYRAALRRCEAQWLEDLPVDDIVRFGWIPSEMKSSAATELLAFFNVSNIAAWREKYRSLEQVVAFRLSPSFESHPAAVAAWLRQGEIEADSTGCEPWNREFLINALPKIRELTRLRRPNHFLPRLRQYCAECGVAVVVVRTPEGCRASGAARLLSPSRAIIQLSFRYLTDDHFWFTFFHEVGHLVLHGDKSLHLEGAEVETSSEQEEREANDFAAGCLIPAELKAEFKSLGASTFDVLRFASKAGISPGIVVGQLQHFGLLRPDYLNRLKRRFEWEAHGSIQPRKGS